MAVTRVDYAFVPDIRIYRYLVSRANFGILTLGQLKYLRAWDTGTGGYVYWGPTQDPASNLSPSATQTTPNYTGTLQNPHVWLVR